MKTGFILFLVVLSISVYGQSGAYRVKKGLKFDYVTIFNNNEFISIRQEDKFPADDTMHFIISDKNGNLKSIKPIISFSNASPHFLVKTKDDGYLINALTDSNQNESFIKLDKNGNIIWKKNNLFHSMSSVQMYSNSLGQTYLILFAPSIINSFITSPGYGGIDILVIKLDKFGNKIWDKSYGGDRDDHFYQALVKNDNKIAILGSSESDSSGNKTSKKSFQVGSEAWVLEIDSNGNITKDKMMFGDPNYYTHTFFYYSKTKDNGIMSQIYHAGSSANYYEEYVKLDSNYNLIWRKYLGLTSKRFLFANDTQSDLILYDNNINTTIRKIDDLGNIVWSQEICNEQNYVMFNNFYYDGTKFLLYNSGLLDSLNGVFFPDSANWLWLDPSKNSISGSLYPDFNSNCSFDKFSEYNIQNKIIHNKVENTYAITNDSTFTIYNFDSTRAILEVLNLDSSLYVGCGRDSIVVNLPNPGDTSNINFPIRSSKPGTCLKINSFSHSILRSGRWATYQLSYQNNAFDSVFNTYVDIEIDTSKIDSISSIFSYTKIGNILTFQLGTIRPFWTATISFNIKLKTSVVIGSSICHRANIFPRCNLYNTSSNDSCKINLQLNCLSNDTVEVEVMNQGPKNQEKWSYLKSYENETYFKLDSFKLNLGVYTKFKYNLNSNQTYTSELFSNNCDQINPILIRHDDQCTNKLAMISNNPALNFSRHDEAREYEEDCDIVRGSYDPNLKSVIPAGLHTEHYTSTGSELKYRIDFQNTGSDTAFRVLLIDTLSTNLDISSFIPGNSSHSYSTEFGGRAVKFIFDPIKLVDSNHNEPLSHGYVCFKINHNKSITPKTKIENKVDIYFDFNAPVRTNTVYNTIFDTILIYVPKWSSSIQGFEEKTISVYPNPATEKVIISLNETIHDLKIELIDMNGKMIQSQYSKNSKSLEFNLLNIQKGIYIIRCMSEDKLLVLKKLEVK